MMNPTHAEFTTSNLNPCEDLKVRLRHHSLMQDYQELHMDTVAMRKRLKTMLNRKATLLDEVRFLRRRYRHLRQEDQPVKQPPGVKKIRGRSNGGKKSKTQIVRVEVSPDSKRSEAEVKHVSLPDLNHTGNETKTSLEKRVPLFDLNQISGEEEEETEAGNNSEERMRVEDSKRMSIIEMQQQKEMKLSSCRNGENGSNKRKISWQDPVAPLRV
ncbi:unnamed protein product [Brassica oleracea var. botrytis]|uniref:BnaC03g12670D protein n=2 Tax=Brassica napus TaxID=3708 RepID=A0A078FEY4_BRANA|nr:uncharacterized protein LOC106385197 [Brassica napus]KAH0888805.1 hypothetical protein HID58_051234 [Brassica napus]CAF1698587.1 unnamed protein product [Brassica napus]CDY11841.1 BnaC03g12670D [Brassica napus]